MTERESWILDNYDQGTTDIIENCKSIEPGYDMMTDGQQKTLQVLANSTHIYRCNLNLTYINLHQLYGDE